MPKLCIQSTFNSRQEVFPSRICGSITCAFQLLRPRVKKEGHASLGNRGASGSYRSSTSTKFILVTVGPPPYAYCPPQSACPGTSPPWGLCCPVLCRECELWHHSVWHHVWHSDTTDLPSRASQSNSRRMGLSPTSAGLGSQTLEAGTWLLLLLSTVSAFPYKIIATASHQHTRAGWYVSSRNEGVVLSLLRIEGVKNWKRLVFLCRCHGNVLDLTHTAVC